MARPITPLHYDPVPVSIASHSIEAIAEMRQKQIELEAIQASIADIAMSNPKYVKRVRALMNIAERLSKQIEALNELVLNRLDRL